jgi:hypothetical protein
LEARRSCFHDPHLPATIKQGKLHFDNLEQFKDYLRTFPDEKRVEVTVDKVKHPRSNQQNRYYHGVVVKLIAKHTGYPVEDVHQALKTMFLTKDIWFNKRGLTITGSSAALDTVAFVEYTEKCRVWANEFLGLNVPLPGEVTV